ncbi:MAG: DUF2779 domain-containing protein [Deltaproteobacteria bacterium]|nr:DUF2779 domain-containing protein [Deltaproteobacteria bacterium]
MSKNLLTKTDYKVARECPTKLYYTKQKYNSKISGNDYLEFLKEGGHIVGEMARVIHPGGIYIGMADGVEAALAKTALEMDKEQVTLFEPVFLHEGMLVAVDILIKKNSTVELIEVKSKSYSSEEENPILSKRGGIKSEWQEYIEDIAFQYQVLKEQHPKLTIIPYLMLPDKAKTTKIDSLASLFQIEKIETKNAEVFQVRFTGNAEELIHNHFLTKVNVEEAIEFVAPLVKLESNKFVKLLNPELVRTQYHLGKHCKDCEFNLGEPSDGYHECWKDIADVKPHIFDLYFGGALKLNGKFLFDELIAQKKVSLFDIPEEVIKGKRGERQALQIACTKDQQEYVNPGFERVLETYRYPLHFIDFETSTSAIPYHKDMRPYEQIAFQWSMHTISAPGTAPEHKEWINLNDSFPSFEFAQTLKRAISDSGTIFMWADHENRVLKDIKRQMVDYGYVDSELRDWIDEVTVDKDSAGRLVDMNKLCLENYFHPEMKGKTSIKYVLPAVWNHNPYLWEISFLKNLLVKEEDQILSPYESLPDIQIGGASQVVKEGTGAMTAYQEMMYGLSRGQPEIKENWSKLLLQYCELDTMAMVIIWIHWRKLFGLNW